MPDPAWMLLCRALIMPRSGLMHVARFASAGTCRPVFLCFISVARRIRSLAIARSFCFLQVSRKCGPVLKADLGSGSLEIRELTNSNAFGIHKTPQKRTGLQHPRNDVRHHHFIGWPGGDRAARAGFDPHELPESHGLVGSRFCTTRIGFHT